jgi:hypothetical protein
VPSSQQLEFLKVFLEGVKIEKNEPPAEGLERRGCAAGALCRYALAELHVNVLIFSRRFCGLNCLLERLDVECGTEIPKLPYF